jgi:hypothetical protein
VPTQQERTASLDWANSRDGPSSSPAGGTALAGCALKRARIDTMPVLATLLHSAAPAGSSAAERELAQGADETHPDLRWSMLALMAGARSCEDRTPPVAEVAALGQRAADLAHERATEAWRSLAGAGRSIGTGRGPGDYGRSHAEGAISSRKPWRCTAGSLSGGPSCMKARPPKTGPSKPMTNSFQRDLSSATKLEHP